MKTNHTAICYIRLLLFFCIGAVFFLGSCKPSTNKKNEHTATTVTELKEAPIKIVELPKPSPISKADEERIYNYAEKWWQSTIMPSVFNGGVLVAYKGNVVFEKYKGSEPLGGRDSVGPNTAMHIASVSKTFTAMAILKMHEENLLNIDDLVSKYLPDFNYDSVTIRNLLSHRSGLPNYLYFTEKMGLDPTSYLSNERLYKILIGNKADIPGIEPPNKRFVYNNTNYALLAYIIEQISGLSYPNYMARNIFIPFGMRDTYVYEPKDSLTATKNYDWRGNPIPNDMLDAIYGDKNIYSTPQDLLKWDRALSKNLYLKPQTIAQAYIPYSNEKAGVRNYGLGWRMNLMDNGKKFIFHTGWWHGNNSIFIRLIDEDATIIAMGNRFTRLTYQAKWLANSFAPYFNAPTMEEGEEMAKDTAATHQTDTTLAKKPVQKKK